MRLWHIRTTVEIVYCTGVPGISIGMWLLLIFLLLVLLVGVVGAIKVTFWALLIALLVVVVAAFLGRAAFSRTS